MDELNISTTANICHKFGIWITTLIKQLRGHSTHWRFQHFQMRELRQPDLLKRSKDILILGLGKNPTKECICFHNINMRSRCCTALATVAWPLSVTVLTLAWCYTTSPYAASVCGKSDLFSPIPMFGQRTFHCFPHGPLKGGPWAFENKSFPLLQTEHSQSAVI